MPIIKLIISEALLTSLRTNNEITIHADNNDNEHPAMPGYNKPDTGFMKLIEKRIEQLKQTGRLRTAETHTAALHQFSRFRNGEDVPVAEITAELMERYQASLRSRNLTMNTISFHMRILRSVYRRSVKQGLTIDRQPFGSVYTGNPKTQKRALTLEQLLRLKQINTTSEKLNFARDMFMLSFYLRGMSFVDMAYLKHTNISIGQLTYKRRKTGQQLTIKWEQPMQEIIDRYPNTRSSYLLPIIVRENTGERNQYRYRQTMINRSLKEVARQAGLDINLTMYCTRHTWATLAREQQVPLNIISSALGHNTERITEVYIKSVDNSTVDKTNERIIQLLGNFRQNNR